MKKIHALIIDPQEDFCNPKGALFVTGADKDSDRLADFLIKFGKKIGDIHVTLDSHRSVDIAHPIFWTNSKGIHPNPFTIISEKDVEGGTWFTTNPSWRQRGIDYVKALSKNSRYPLCIWPPHCLIGTWGHSIAKTVSDALVKWENDVFGVIDFVTKGSNIFTEHYSAYKADVPDASDPTTMPNTDLLSILQEADEILISGQALSHCVRNTVQDICDGFGVDNTKKFVLLRDTSSNVSGFEKMGEDFVRDMVGRGMRVTTTKDYLA